MICEPTERIDQIASEVVDAALEVHKTLGPGYLERVYEEALGVELKLRGLSFARQKTIRVDYKGHRIGRGQVDLLVERRLIVELKVVDNLGPVHRAQVISYLKTLDLPIGFLINFNTRLLKDGIKRIVSTGR